ncbi:MAG: 3'(2'),5'-bisphosphate nucleotidase [Algisphaera sp.]
MNLDKHLEVAVSAVRAASVVCQRVQADLVNAKTLEKGDKSPVTVADFAAQAVVCGALREAFADLPVVGEEAADDLRPDVAADLRAAVAQHAGMTHDQALSAIDFGGWTPDGSQDMYWTLDPIDGTKGFLRGEQYAVALGLIVKGRVVLGVLGCPNLDGGLLMAATAGGGTRLLSLAGEGVAGEPVRVSDVTDSTKANFCESVESGHSDQGTSAKIAATLGITDAPYRIDSQCKYAAVARGNASIYLRLPTRPGYEEKIWDHAAGLLVVEEAGGRVTDIEGKDLDFSCGRTLANNRGVVATNGALHEVVIAAVGAAMGG